MTANKQWVAEAEQAAVALTAIRDGVIVGNVGAYQRQRINSSLDSYARRLVSYTREGKLEHYQIVLMQAEGYITALREAGITSSGVPYSILSPAVIA